METFFIALIALYLAKILLFRIGAGRASVPLHVEHEPHVSIIVAARNEEKNIDACIASLARCRYPADRREILLVDDQSTDATGAIIDTWAERVPNLRRIVPQEALGGLRGKANAVAQAVAEAKGEIILTTDADCEVPAEWIRETVAQYGPDIGTVCGYTLLRDEGLFSGMQSLDWAYMLTIASAGVGLGYPLSAVGNNMSYRKQAYDDVGGYAGVGFSVTEDFALFKAIVYKTQWKARYPTGGATLVWSGACSTFKELFRQKKRWGRGGTAMHPAGILVMAVGFLASVSIWVLPWFGLPLPLWALGLACKLAGDGLLLRYTLRQLGQMKLMRHLPLFELYYLIYVTLLLFVVFLGGRTVWKDRRL